MTKRKTNAKTSAAALTAGSAENIIEDRAPALDGAEDVNADLQQPCIAEDLNSVDAIFTGLQALFTSERNFVDPNTGEMKVTNDRGRALRIVANNFVQQLNYILKIQASEIRRRETHVANVRDNRQGDEDGSIIANAETWAEREFDKFQTYVAMRDRALEQYQVMFGEEFGASDRKAATRSKASDMIARAGVS